LSSVPILGPYVLKITWIVKSLPYSQLGLLMGRYIYQPGGSWETSFYEPKLLIICDPASSGTSFSSQTYVIHVFKVFMSLVRPFF